MPDQKAEYRLPNVPADPQTQLARLFLLFYVVFFAVGLGWMAFRRGWDGAWAPRGWRP